MATTLTRTASRSVSPSPLLLWLFLGYVLFWYLQGGYRFEALGQIRFEFILGGFLSICAAIVLVRNGMPRSPIVGWIIAFLVVTLLSVLFSVNVAFSFEIFVDRVIKFLMMGVFIVAFVTTPNALRWFFGAYLLAFLKMAQEGIFGIVSGSLIWENQGTMRLHGATPNYAHPNSFAGTQLGVVPFAVYLSTIVKTHWRVLLLIQAAAAMIIVVYTGSRTGYVAVGAMLFGFFLLAKSRKKMLLVLSLLVLASAPLIPDEYWERFDTIRTQEDKEGASIDLRKEILSDAWSVFVSHPFGVGAGAFPEVRSNMFGRSQDTHNLLLEVATNMGIQGVIVFIGLLIAIFQSLRRTLRAASAALARLSDEDDSVVEQRRDWQLVHAATRALLCFLIIRLALGLFGHDLYEIYWWFSAGLAISLEQIAIRLRDAGEVRQAAGNED